MALTPSLVRTHDVTHALLALAALTGPVQGLRGQQPHLGTTTAPIVTQAGLRFRDLNRNGQLDPYEDWRRSPSERALDLVGRMTLEEKAGTAVHGTAPIAGGPLASGPAYDTTAAVAAILTRHATSLITRMSVAPSDMARQSNVLQAIAERGRLGIPLTISTDPRNHFQIVGGASVSASGFSQWPETPGFGAIGDTALVRQFASIVREEYRAVGIHMALSPQADLATEPRWSRIIGTFGEDPERVRDLVAAYVVGLQGGASGLTHRGVATIVKHWVGYGASVDGFDGHNYYGRFSRFPAGRFADHVTPFRGAFAARVAGVMPTYNILDGLALDGQPVEAVGAGYNAQLLSGLLRGRYGFRGVVVSDWGITRDCDSACRTGVPRQTPAEIAMPWGVESLTPAERFAKGMNAGIDQFGGIDDGAPLVDAVHAGAVSLTRLDDAVQRILQIKFELGVFEDPYVDPAHASLVVGAESAKRLGTRTQARAMVVLENTLGRMPLAARGVRLFLSGVDTGVAVRRGFRVVSSAGDADYAVIRLAAPYKSTHPGFFFGSFQHEGDLDFPEGSPQLELVNQSAAKVKTIVIVSLDRPAILTPLTTKATVLLADFGASDDAVFDVLMGRVPPVGRLPFELPSSMEAVRQQAPDAPHDSSHPLYPIGYHWHRR